MKRPAAMLRGRGLAVRQWWWEVDRISERDLLLGAILLTLAASAATAFILVQYYQVDVFSSLCDIPYDCWLDTGTKIGRHCFSDYTMPVVLGMRPNPWEPFPVYLLPGDLSHVPYLNNYPAAAMVPQLTFGFLGEGLHTPLLGLFCYLFVLTLAVLAPSVWAARGTRGVERIVVFVACGAAAIPAWAVLDRGNSVGFVVPIALVFLVALCRQRWGLVTIMVVLAALVKPQFAVLGVVLLVARQWRWCGMALLAGVLSNAAAYLLWPRDFPQTILASLRNTVGPVPAEGLGGAYNMSFGKALLTAPDAIAALTHGGTLPAGYLGGVRPLVGYAILLVVVVALSALGRRVPPVMAGVVLLATASLFLPLTNRYYLVFALPVAALVARAPDGPLGSGIFDRFSTLGGRRRVVSVCVSLAAALSIGQIALPSRPFQGAILGQMGAPGIVGTTPLVATTAILAPVLWLIACAAVIVSYARKPASAAD